MADVEQTRKKAAKAHGAERDGGSITATCPKTKASFALRDVPGRKVQCPMCRAEMYVDAVRPKREPEPEQKKVKKGKAKPKPEDEKPPADGGE